MIDEEMNMTSVSSGELEHYGTPRHSGRYPWGSGKDPYQRTGDFLSQVRELEKSGMSESEVCNAMGMTMRQLRARKSASIQAERAALASEVYRLKQKGYSNTKIAEMLNLSGESHVRNLLKPSTQNNALATENTVTALKEGLKNSRFLDVGKNMGAYLGVSDTRLDTAVQRMVDEEGYKVYPLKVEQLGTEYKTTYKILCPPDTQFMDMVNNRDEIGYLTGVKLSENGTRLSPFGPPQSISSDRVQVRFGDEGGKDMDGVILVRPGVEDTSLGSARYAQVRILVDDNKYLKGMAMYSDDLPKGCDLLFNTNKTRADCDGDKMKAMKNVENDPENPFKAVPIDQRGVMNIINDEGTWANWSKSLSSQMLSKQPVSLAKKQLTIDYENRKAEFEEIMQITNPAVRKKMLKEFSDECDGAAVHLKAAAMPRQASHVILPFPDMKENEIYAPNYQDGETVVLIRHPHGGKFEIPTLTVNNKDPAAKKALGNTPDAVGINPRVAERLSGADFDGDSVLVIPNNNGAIKTKSPLKGLKDFNPSDAYPPYEGMTKVGKGDGFHKQAEMGKVSNLITDMTLKGADDDEIAAAVRHSMVVIDAEKHNLNWKQSAVDNNIRALKEKYQGGPNAGASTLISKAKSVERVPQRKQQYGIDPETGEILYRETGATYEKNGKTNTRTTKTTKMAVTKDAYELSSGTDMENVYADYANKCKALGNSARKEMLGTPSQKYDPSARKAYAAEVESLQAKLKTAQANSPKERQAQLLGNLIVAEKKRENPEMDYEELSKLKGKALISSRARVGAKKTRVTFTDREWEAVQAGAVSNNTLMQLLTNADSDEVKRLATPRTSTGLTSTQLSRVKALSKNGYTQAEIAKQLGVSATTISNALNLK